MLLLTTQYIHIRYLILMVYRLSINISESNLQNIERGFFMLKIQDF